jgi:hypothetical protein
LGRHLQDICVLRQPCSQLVLDRISIGPARTSWPDSAHSGHEALHGLMEFHTKALGQMVAISRGYLRGARRNLERLRNSRGGSMWLPRIVYDTSLT